MSESEVYLIIHFIDGIGLVRTKRLKERFGTLEKWQLSGLLRMIHD